MQIDGHTDTTEEITRPQTRFVRLLLKLPEIISVAMFAALFLTFVAQVFWRFVLRDPLVWTL